MKKLKKRKKQKKMQRICTPATQANDFFFSAAYLKHRLDCRQREGVAREHDVRRARLRVAGLVSTDRARA